MLRGETRAREASLPWVCACLGERRSIKSMARLRLWLSVGAPTHKNTEKSLGGMRTFSAEVVSNRQAIIRPVGLRRGGVRVGIFLARVWIGVERRAGA